MTGLQPDQKARLWDDHVAVYEAVFEPLTTAIGCRVLDRLALSAGGRMIDVGAGAGGVALMAQSRGIDVLAVDASERMMRRVRVRAEAACRAPGRIHASVMDGAALAVREGGFDAAISLFGVILLPDAAGGVREMVRAVRPGGRVAVVTWTDTQRYELMSRLLDAIGAIRGPQPPPAILPAQLRFRAPGDFTDLLASAGLRLDPIVRIEEQWRLPSARWLAAHIGFAPGMSALLEALGADRQAVLERFVTALERDQGTAQVALTAVAALGIGTKPGGE